jgi:RluA family pseudouridine synthase
VAKKTLQTDQMTIEYENDDIVIVNKPAGLAVQDITQWTPAHRLDKQTSGLLALAKSQQGLEFLRSLFKSRNITKEYLALVYGRIERHGVIDKPLVKIGHEGSSRVRVHESGRKSVTEYWPEKHCYLGVDEFTLVRVKLHTGRTHQIRVHFLSEKHPVMGDDLYGKPQSQKLSQILPRQFLHASRLEFKLPDGTWLEVESKLPEDLQSVLNQLDAIH